MTVSTEGFRGGDRTDISLPKGQESLLKAVSATGKPVVLLLLNGSALAVNWASENVPAILEAWYPGEEGGAAIADVLFGDYNPGARLPVTFYKSTAQLLPFEDYSMQGRTYRYFKGDPLYPFGFGLSYTTFKFDNVRVEPQTILSGATTRVFADVTNTGTREGDEVAQMYIHQRIASVTRPVMELRGFKRVTLRPGEKTTVEFELTPAALSMLNEDMHPVVEPGTFDIMVGPSSVETTSVPQQVQEKLGEAAAK